MTSNAHSISKNITPIHKSPFSTAKKTADSQKFQYTINFITINLIVLILIY